MPTLYPELFQPIRIGPMELRNRIVAPPMVQVRSIVSREGIAWYRRLAAGGAGLVIVEATGVPRFGADLTATTLRPLVKAIHTAGARAAIQLFPIQFGETRDVNALTKGEIQAIVADYAQAAAICRYAEFDAVEVHGAHGYLINQFFMPDVNTRTDEYGGTLENRCRFGVEIVARLRAALGKKLAILYRHTPVGKAYWINDSITLAERVIDAGAEVLDISPARDKLVGDLAAPFKARFPKTPVIAVRGMEDPEAANAAIKDQRCDLVAVGRSLICDAQWPVKVREGRLDQIVRCLKCDQGCFGNLKARKLVYCKQWKTDPLAPYAGAD